VNQISIKTNNQEVFIYNFLGELIFSSEMIIKEEIMVDISKYLPGFYFVKTGTNCCKFIKE